MARQSALAPRQVRRGRAVVSLVHSAQGPDRVRRLVDSHSRPDHLDGCPDGGREDTHMTVRLTDVDPSDPVADSVGVLQGYV